MSKKDRPKFKFRDVDQLRRNRDIERDGTLLGVGPVTFLVRAATDENPAWKQFGDEFRNNVRRLARANASEERTKEFLAENFVKIFILDWPTAPIDDASGESVPFSREACVEFLMQTDDAIPLIQAMVYDTQYFRGDRIEGVVEQVKNS